MGGLKRVRSGTMEIFKPATMHFLKPLILLYLYNLLNRARMYVGFLYHFREFMLNR